MNFGGHDLVGFVIVIVGGSLAVWGIFRAVRYHLKLFRSRNWPTVRGTVQKGEILQGGATTFLYVPCRSLLGYSYTIDGSPYFGFFAFIAQDRETAEKLQKEAEGQAVTVRYNPKSPAESLLDNRELLGRRVMQDPFYLDQS